MTLPKQVTDGLREAISLHLKNSNEGLIFEVESIDGEFVKNLRHRLGQTQREFAIRYGFSLKTIQNWEAGYRFPEGPARAYLLVISEIPSEVLAAFEAASKRRARRKRT